jgi:GNAT superfamily N-acetyltransferase
MRQTSQLEVAQASSLVFRNTPQPTDADSVRKLAEATGLFSPSEIEVAVELVIAALHAGVASGYRFLFADCDGRPCGYTCYGPVPCTADSFDLYWIVVDAAHQGRGIGRLLLEETERLIHHAGGRRVYAETSSRRQYHPTRTFYRHTGFRQVARLKDFYAPGDAKIIFCKQPASVSVQSGSPLSSKE